jgi:EF hand
MKARPIVFGAVLVGSVATAAAGAQQSQARRTDLRDRQEELRAMDRDNDGVITRAEWRGTVRSFRRLDVNRDGVLSGTEIWTDRPRDVPSPDPSPAYRAGRERGLADGRQAGREDKTINGGKWDLEGQRELETADAGYRESVGPRIQYQAGYRAGFRLGYREGFGPR